MVTAELDIFVGVAPHPRIAARTDALLELTLLRAEYTRGRSQSEAPSNMDRTRSLAKRLANFCNGDWSKPRVQHFCWKPGCCVNEAGVRDPQISRRAAAAILGEAVLEPLPVIVPACNRWYTFSMALDTQSLGFVCHRILPRAVLAAFDEDSQLLADADAAEDGDEFRVVQAKKLRKAINFMEDPQADLVLLSAAVMTAPSSHLSNRLQAHSKNVKNKLL